MAYGISVICYISTAYGVSSDTILPKDKSWNVMLPVIEENKIHRLLGGLRYAM